MRIAIDVTPALRQGAGVGRYTRELARELLLRGAHDYVPFVADRLSRAAAGGHSLGPSSPALCSTGVAARWMNVLWHRLGLPLSAERWTGAVDVFHATDFLAPPLTDAQAVVTVHDLSFLRVPDRADPGLRRYLERTVPRSVSGAGHVLADSQNSRCDVIELLGVPADKVSVAYPGVGEAFAEVEDVDRLSTVRDRYGLDRPFVLGVGTIEPRKDWPSLIAAFEQAGLPDHMLVIAGGHGWLTDATDRALVETSSDVRMVGFIADDDLAPLYSLATAFAYPSVYEGFGLPPLEAMACSTPTVVSDSSCLPEVVGDAALVVKSGDVAALAETINQLVNDEALRERLRVDGPEQASRFTWAGCAQAAEEAYRLAADLPR